MCYEQPCKSQNFVDFFKKSYLFKGSTKGELELELDSF